jgi:hypothetical protein
LSSSMTCTPYQYYPSDEIKKNDKGWVFGTYGDEESTYTWLLSANERNETTSKT